ncbi:hypothetical protein [Micromonospora sp. NPDC049891]|uniref:hypothetical protein n=1 Tax=Micromonospora sp. NPDC049891 TaxID=3155655 RepID=UPI0033DD6C44
MTAPTDTTPDADLLAAAGLTPDAWRYLVDLTGTSETGRVIRGGVVLRRLRERGVSL